MGFFCKTSINSIIIFSHHLDCNSNQLSCNLQLQRYKQARFWKKNFMFMKNHLNGQVNWTPESNRSTCRYHIGHMQYCMREAYSTISIVPANLIYSLFTLHCESKSCHLYIIHFLVALGIYYFIRPPTHPRCRLR